MWTQWQALDWHRDVQATGAPESRNMPVAMVVVTLLFKEKPGVYPKEYEMVEGEEGSGYYAEADEREDEPPALRGYSCGRGQH